MTPDPVDIILARELCWQNCQRCPNEHHCDGCQDQHVMDGHHGDNAHSLKQALKAAGYRIVGPEQPITSEELAKLVAELPERMRQARRSMPSETRLLVAGVRTAAKAVGISPTTYCRAEKDASKIDLSSVRKILKWTEAMLEASDE